MFWHSSWVICLNYESLWRHTSVRKMAHMRIRTGFDKSFPRNGLVFVIWRAEYSLLSTLEQFLYQTERSFWLVGCFVDTLSLSFFKFFWLFGHIEVIYCVTVTKFWPSKFLGQFHTVLPNVSQSLNHQNRKPTGRDIGHNKIAVQPTKTPLKIPTYNLS